MDKIRIAIVGAGLAGLYAAWRLERMGCRDYVVLEARVAPGGRIASFDVDREAGSRPDGIDRFDLGPAWFWPDYQTQLGDLIDALALPRFRQHETGATVIEHAAGVPPLRVRGYVNAPASMRLAGGMAALVDALQRGLDPSRLLPGQTVRRLRRTDGHVRLDGEDAAGRTRSWDVEQVLLALPPRLAEQSIVFEPALPEELAAQWRATPTWMAAHAKYIAVYDTPFWRDQGLSGEARSRVGPLGEIHDASLPGGRAALFGFFGVPAAQRRQWPDEVLRARCRAQFARLFGAQAATPRTDVIKDWARDPRTAVGLDLAAAPAHHAATPAQAASGPWRQVLTGIASEWAPQFPGYVAGAVEAAELGVRGVVLRVAAPRPAPF